LFRFALTPLSSPPPITCVPFIRHSATISATPLGVTGTP
jgi:hypothetical protein